MRVIVCGSRKWPQERMRYARSKIAARIRELPTGTTVVHGAARGADSIAHKEAQMAGLLVEPHPANWLELGDAAGPTRNREMAELGADLCIAFWDGMSTGTRGMIAEAERCGIPVEKVMVV